MRENWAHSARPKVHVYSVYLWLWYIHKLCKWGNQRLNFIYPSVLPPLPPTHSPAALLHPYGVPSQTATLHQSQLRTVPALPELFTRCPGRITGTRLDDFTLAITATPTTQPPTSTKKESSQHLGSIKKKTATKLRVAIFLQCLVCCLLNVLFVCMFVAQLLYVCCSQN
jgi:hypothetical protein